MSIAATNAVRDKRLGSSRRKLILMLMADYADADWSCFVGQERLAAQAEVNVRTVQRVLASLEAEGLIAREKRYGNVWGRTSDRTTIVQTAIEALPDILSGRESKSASLHDNMSDLPAKSAALPDSDVISSRHSLSGDPSGNRQVHPSGEPSRGRARGAPNDERDEDWQSIRVVFEERGQSIGPKRYLVLRDLADGYRRDGESPRRGWERMAEHAATLPTGTDLYAALLSERNERRTAAARKEAEWQAVKRAELAWRAN